jgi:hypothetical protein
MLGSFYFNQAQQIELFSIMNFLTGYRGNHDRDRHGTAPYDVRTRVCVVQKDK